MRDIKKIIVVKIGTSVLTDKGGNLDAKVISHIVRQTQELKRSGLQVVIVSSGAIVAGMQILNLSKRPGYLPDIQACAAVGQTQLMNMYDAHFKKLKLVSAQVLLTQDDINNRTRYLNARNTILALLKRNSVPIVNENDTVSTEEIKFGDNDRLSALVANLIEAHKLIIMSNVEGLYRYDIKDRTKRELIHRVDNITEDIERLALDECSSFGVGGMYSKIEAAKMATNAGIECMIIDGKIENILLNAVKGKKLGTVFTARQPKISARKRWIAYSSRTAGNIQVDEGAKEVLVKKNRSLLASGIINCTGRFNAGETVSIVDAGNKEFARGITYYSSTELIKIKGQKAKDIEKILGYKYYDEVIHRDNLVIL
ncbi:MAG: glutamate 5-kinase [Candidatus Omnitrophica bacterium]|nr:glutamate 5-kinase [Candidatus Omnitrophota bacterium]